MNQLINVMDNGGVLVVGSREIANNFGKRHDHIIRDIKNLIGGLPQNWGHPKEYFIQGEYTSSENKQSYREYFLTRDSFALLVMGFTGKKAIEWKVKYIDEFNRMEEALRDPYKHLSAELKAIFVIDKKHQEIEQRVGTLEDRMTIDYGQQLVLQNFAKTSAMKYMNGKDSLVYKDAKMRNRVFSKVWKEFKDYFEVNSYKNTPKKDFEKAKEYLKSWRPEGKLLKEIEQMNLEN